MRWLLGIFRKLSSFALRLSLMLLTVWRRFNRANRGLQQPAVVGVSGPGLGTPQSPFETGFGAAP